MYVERNRRLVTAAVLAVVAVALLLVLRGGDDYSVRARMIDAGGLVPGSLVQVGGKSVGTVGELRLTNDGLAEVELKISDDEFRPLREDTRAVVRAVSQSGVANRYVELTPAAAGPELADGGVLPATRTQPIVDLDVLLNAFDARTRRSLRGVVTNAAKLARGDAPKQMNRMLGTLDKALAQGRATLAELVREPAAQERLLLTGAATARALASRPEALERSIEGTAQVLQVLAGERRSLDSILARAPGLLRHASSTLDRVRATLRDARPALRDAQPAAAPLARALRLLPSAAGRSAPLIGQLRSMLPDLRMASRGLPGLARVAIPALASTTSALIRAQPIFEGLRPYAPDLANALFVSTNSTASNYDANGHYLRFALNIPGNSGIFAPLAAISIGDLRGIRTGLDARCPGAAAAPAPDASNPWIPDKSLCDPEDGQ